MSSRSSKTKPRAPRKYEPLWEKIKREETATIECHYGAVKTIKTALINEKCQDTGFQLLNEDENWFLEFSVEVIKDAPFKRRMTIILKTKLGLSSLNV